VGILSSRKSRSGYLNNHFGTDIFPVRAEDGYGRRHEECLAHRHGGGAEIIKTSTRDVAGFRSSWKPAGAVIVAGGRNWTGRTNPFSGSRTIAWARGRRIIFGRNVWQHPKMERLINAICAIVHEEESVQSALKLLR